MALSSPSVFSITEDSFRDIYEQYWGSVYSICYANLQDQELAKEMVQDIFKSLWERKEDLTITHSIKHYLFRSAKFKVFEHFRNQKIQQQHLEQIGTQQTQASNVTENEILGTSLSERLALLIDSLPQQCQRVFRMSREQGLTNKEIASSLFITERTVEYHISKALSSLKSSLHGYSLGFLTMVVLREIL